jgi:hypothetical protein
MDSSKKLGIAAAFKAYGAKLKNARWAVSAIAEDGSLVMSCRETYLRKGDKCLAYIDSLSRWAEGSQSGQELLRTHLTDGLGQSLPVRLVVAHSAAAGGPRTSEWFHVRPDLVGQVVLFDGDQFRIEFRKAA